MAQIEIKKKDIERLMSEGKTVEQIAEALNVKVGGVKAAAKAFNLNLRKKPTSRTPKYVFVDDSSETSVTDAKLKKVKEVKTEEVVESTTEASNSFVSTLLSKQEEPVVEDASEETSQEQDEDFSL